MTAAGHHGDLQPIDLARMAHRGRDRPVRNSGVRDLERVRKFVGESAQSAAQHNRHTRYAACLRANIIARRPHYSSMPAMQPALKFAMVPAATAFNPSRARCDLRMGASAPIPPIWMAMELKFANPHNA